MRHECTQRTEEQQHKAAARDPDGRGARDGWRGNRVVRVTRTDEVRGTHSRATGAVRLLLAAWLIFMGVRTLGGLPHQASADLGPPLGVLLPLAGQGVPLGVLLPLAGLSFTLGVFLLTGFMTRVCALILVCLGVWDWLNLGVGVMPAVLALVGLYLMLRGGGAWAMDIYVQKVQDRARRKAAINSPQSS